MYADRRRLCRKSCITNPVTDTSTRNPADTSMTHPPRGAGVAPLVEIVQHGHPALPVTPKNSTTRKAIMLA